MDHAVLSPRLAAAASCIPRGSVVADVGADHASLSIYLLSSGISPYVIVSDINPLPLERARLAIEESGFGPKARFCLADGMKQLFKYSPDCFAVCGMGGDTISSMLDGDKSVFDGKTFVFQPMTKHEKLRAALYSGGFFIDRETVVAERGRPFVIIASHYDGIKREAGDLELLAGRERGIYPELICYYRQILKRLEKRASGLEISGRDASFERALADSLRARMN
ncbi:MAG: SAM-dependent methyltransferase [Clostridia bacterium]|nr:SAM-dependent methyltransferase [Clostridia bacterium]